MRYEPSHTILASRSSPYDPLSKLSHALMTPGPLRVECHLFFQSPFLCPGLKEDWGDEAAGLGEEGDKMVFLSPSPYLPLLLFLMFHRLSKLYKGIINGGRGGRGEVACLCAMHVVYG